MNKLEKLCETVGHSWCELDNELIVRYRIYARNIGTVRTCSVCESIQFKRHGESWAQPNHNNCTNEEFKQIISVVNKAYKFKRREHI